MVGLAVANTTAWLRRRGCADVSGTLELGGNRVAFATAEGIVFDAAIADVAARWPWYCGGACMKLRVGRNTYSLCFVSPAARIAGFPSGRRAARRWKALLDVARRGDASVTILGR